MESEAEATEEEEEVWLDYLLVLLPQLISELIIFFIIHNEFFFVWYNFLSRF
ncbi:MAG TPA: hypothetical protein VE244_12755 [Nitrososphaeraceae archaeon]|nr:hypothetical protein [Nitrososphaeraceae archaeon]